VFRFLARNFEGEPCRTPTTRLTWTRAASHEGQLAQDHRTKVRPSQARSVWSRRCASRSRVKSALVLLSTRV
jgi:hypothetical protein